MNHDIKPIAQSSNAIWLSDIIEVICHGEKPIYIGIIVDIYNCKVISHTGSTDISSSAIIKNLIRKAAEKRQTQLQTTISAYLYVDNCYIFRTNDVKIYARLFGLNLHYMSSCSTRFKGLIERIWMNITRNYINYPRRPDARIVLAQLQAWIECYNKQMT